MKFEFKKLKSNTLGGVLFHFSISMGILLLLAIFYFYIYLPKSTNHGESITVPNIEGFAIADLEKELEKRSLRFEVNDSSYSSEFPPLTVLKQYPVAGARVKEGRKIFISVNRVHPPTVPVPDLVDGSVINADAVLRSNELKRGRIELVPGPFNIVKEMRWKGSKINHNTRVPKGSVIDLVVMDGGSNTYDDGIDVLGQTLEDAKVLIYGYNLNLNVTVVGDTTGNNPVILKQKPAPGQNIKVGDVVHVWVGSPDAEIDDEQ
jgi:eukaryotic-like serine/threonine-protein kinase